MKTLALFVLLALPVTAYAQSLQLQIDEQAYGFPCTPPAANYVDDAGFAAACCGGDTVECAPHWACNIGGAIYIDEQKCNDDPGPAVATSQDCLDKALNHEQTEVCYGGDICDADENVFWVVQGEALADCAYPIFGQTSVIGGCSDLLCWYNATHNGQTPVPCDSNPFASIAQNGSAGPCFGAPPPSSPPPPPPPPPPSSGCDFWWCGPAP